MSLPSHLKSQIINAMINYKAASDALDLLRKSEVATQVRSCYATLENVAPSMNEWYGYISQNHNMAGYMAKSNMSIPPKKLALVQNAWTTFDHYNQLIKQAQEMGYDYAIYIMPLSDHYIGGSPLTV